MTRDGRPHPKVETANQTLPTSTPKVAGTADTPRGVRFYLVRGVRRRPSGEETTSTIRRTRPAAERKAAEWVDLGREPVTIHTAWVPSWSPVAREEP